MHMRFVKRLGTETVAVTEVDILRLQIPFVMGPDSCRVVFGLYPTTESN